MGAILILVEMRGIEPLSENLLIQLSPGAVYRLVFSVGALINKLPAEATVLCVIGSTVTADARSPLT